MVFGMGRGEKVVLDTELLKEVNKTSMIFLIDLLNGFAFLIGGNGNRRAVGIRSGDHQNVVTF